MSKSEAFQMVLKPMRQVFSPPTTMAKADEDAALEQYADALSAFSAPVLDAGWREVRDGNRRGFWPPIGALVEACESARKRFTPPRAKVAPQLNGRLVDGRYQRWGGGCQCDRCVRKTRSEGFWQTPAHEDHP